MRDRPWVYFGTDQRSTSAFSRTRRSATRRTRRACLTFAGSAIGLARASHRGWSNFPTSSRADWLLLRPVGYAKPSVRLLGCIHGSVRRVGRGGEVGLASLDRRGVGEAVVSVLSARER